VGICGSGLGNGEGPLKVDYRQWDLLKAALDKANGRVMIAKRKVIALRKEEDEIVRGRTLTEQPTERQWRLTQTQNQVRRTTQPPSKKLNGSFPPTDDHVESPALTTAVKAFNSLTGEQKSVLSRTLDGFAACLVPLPSEPNKNEFAREVIQENVWHNRINWGAGEWNAWETWGWYRHFCGSVCLISLFRFMTRLSTVCLIFTRFLLVFCVFANVLDHVGYGVAWRESRGPLTRC
jgi:nuclear cap-binding protein subunit 1